MAFEEVFAPGMARAREELERESILPAPPPVAGPPLVRNDTPGVEVPSLDSLTPFAEPSRRDAAHPASVARRHTSDD